MTTALIFGLLTMAWPYTQSYFSDPICGWALFAAAYGLVAYASRGASSISLAPGWPGLSPI